jgi:hypothetical protein
MVNHPINLSKSNDEDLVPPERYSRRKKGRALPLKFNDLKLENTRFQPINLEDKAGRPNLTSSFMFLALNGMTGPSRLTTSRIRT